ncbi:MAG: ribonuclease HI family protein [Promethearchaeota archaeon]
MINNQSFTLYTDGGARGNPGPAAIGIVLIDMHGTVIVEMKKCIGTATNNQAEYNALLAGLDLAAKSWKGDLTCISDSELVIKQMNGEYKVRNKVLLSLYNQVKKLESNFTSITFKHEPRTNKMVSRADALVNEALDAR